MDLRYEKEKILAGTWQSSTITLLKPHLQKIQQHGADIKNILWLQKIQPQGADLIIHLHYALALNYLKVWLLR